jgi:N-acetylmuramoyl-L-alanine amidase
VRDIDAIVVHCSDSPDDIDPRKPGEQDNSSKDIDAWHKANGWAGIGYHYVVRKDGTIEVGRFESSKGAHCKPMNERSIGVCWVGRKKPSALQRMSLVHLVRELMHRYGVSVHRVFGHCETEKTQKTCPNIDMIAFRTEVGQ